MRRSIVVLLAVVGAVLLNVGSASAQVCVNVSGFCNHYFFGVSATGAPDVFAIDGFEYGCGQSRTRHASGVIRAVADRLEIEFTGTNEQFDFTQTVAWSGEVAANLMGNYKVLYTYLNLGVLTAHGASGTITLAECAEPAKPTAIPAKPTAIDGDASLPGGATP